VGLSRIAAAAFLSVAMAAISPSVVAQSEPPPATGDATYLKLSAAANVGPQKLSIAMGKGAVIEFDRDVRDIFVASPDIADAAVRTPRRIFVTALKVGTTNLILLDSNGDRVGTLEITVAADVVALNDQLARTMPGSRVKAEALSDGIVLHGTVGSAAEASEAQALATRVAGQATRVVNGLRIEQPSQVMIQVRVAEMSRTIAKQFGANITAAIGQTGDGVPIFASTGNQFSLLGRALSAISGARVGSIGPCSVVGILADCNGSPNNAQGVVQAMERLGLVHTLAEPNLTAVSGEAAKFLVGGEFPVPVSKDREGNVLVSFKPFGVALAFTPVVLDKGHISLRVSTEISELTNNGAFVLEGFGNSGGLSIPGLSVRRAETTVELPSGGSLVIGGLLQQATKQNIDGFPGLKDLPILGALFRSRDFQNNETELVVMVTAYLVDPVSEARLARPDTGFVAPTDIEAILFGRLNAVYGDRANSLSGAPPNTVGYVIE